MLRRVFTLMSALIARAVRGDVRAAGVGTSYARQMPYAFWRSELGISVSREFLVYQGPPQTMQTWVIEMPQVSSATTSVNAMGPTTIFGSMLEDRPRIPAIAFAMGPFRTQEKHSGKLLSPLRLRSPRHARAMSGVRNRNESTAITVGAGSGVMKARGCIAFSPHHLVTPSPPHPPRSGTVNRTGAPTTARRRAFRAIMAATIQRAIHTPAACQKL